MPFRDIYGDIWRTEQCQRGHESLWAHTAHLAPILVAAQVSGQFLSRSLR